MYPFSLSQTPSVSCSGATVKETSSTSTSVPKFGPLTPHWDIHRSGHAFNAFPKMGDSWIPEEVLSMKPLLRNFFQNIILITRVSDLKATVLALQDMQLNNAATLHAIRQKYMHKQFNSVATLTSQKPVKPLF